MYSVYNLSTYYKMFPDILHFYYTRNLKWYYYTAK